MKESLLFEHLVNNYCIKCNGWGASIFRACSSKDSTYENGFRIGEVNAYMKVSLHNLYDESSKEKQEIIRSALDKMNEPCGYDELSNILNELNNSKVIF